MNLTDRAATIIAHLAAGLTLQETAERLQISCTVAGGHVARARRDNGCKTTTQLVALWAHGGVSFNTPALPQPKDPMAQWQRSYRKRHVDLVSGVVL